MGCWEKKFDEPFPLPPALPHMFLHICMDYQDFMCLKEAIAVLYPPRYRPPFRLGSGAGLLAWRSVLALT